MGNHHKSRDFLDYAEQEIVSLMLMTCMTGGAIMSRVSEFDVSERWVITSLI